MNRSQFLQEIKELFPDVTAGKTKGYLHILTDSSGKKINYNKLYAATLQQWQHQNSPSPAWLYEKMQHTKTFEQQETALERDLKSGAAKIVKEDETTMWITRVDEKGEHIGCLYEVTKESN